MLQNLNDKFSAMAHIMKRSAIREILKLTQKAEMISFAGGLPSPDTFPVDEVKEITSYILETQGAAALQYGTTEGDPLLREMILKHHESQNLVAGQENLAICTGAQQALDIVGKIFINPGDYIICELPSYLGGIAAFSVYGAKMKGIPLDEKGMRADLLEEAVQRLTDLGKKIKFIYTIPDFQNPTGITMPEERRLEILNIADKYDLLVIEDSPYRDIRFEGTPQETMYQLDKSGRVVTLCTFSKTFAPGFRVAWLLGHKDIIDKFIMAKQSADICSPVILQKIIAEYMQRGLLNKNLKKTIDLYHKRKDLMLECFEKFMPEGVQWTRPEGGLFLFITLPETVSTDEVFTRAIENNVAFVKGSVFYCTETCKNTMRMNFSYSPEHLIEKGIKRLATVISEIIAEQGNS